MVEKMIGKRLKIIRQELGLSQIEMANALSISVKGYWNYENDEREPKLELLKKIVEKFKVNALWLLTGEDDIFINNVGNKYNNLLQTKPLDIEEGYKNFGKRLTVIQDNNCFTDSKMADILKISHCFYINLKLCKKEPDIKIINNIKKYFNIDVNWLLYGEEGYIHRKDSSVKYPGLTSDEIMILKKIASKNDII